VAHGGTGAASASGTALDNISGFASTGFLTRTGAGAYSFQSLTNGISLGNIAQIAANTVLGNATGSTANAAAQSMPSCSGATNALKWTTSTGFGCNTISGTGTVTTTGSPASGNLAKFSGSTSVTNGDLSGDVTTSGTLATTIANSSVTLAKIANAAANSKLVGSGASGSGAAYVEVTLGSNLSMSGTTLNAGGSSGWAPYSSTTTSGSQASVTVSSIPSTSRNMKIVVSARGDTAATSTQLRVQFNGDTGANYDNQYVAGIGSTASASSNNGLTYMTMVDMPAASATAGRATSVVFEVPNYAGTTFDKQTTNLGSSAWGTTAGTLESIVLANTWRSTAAVTSVKIFPQAGNFVDGSTIDIYLY
jgi:hypothetical protein